jgi:hypothetical protein
MTFFNKKEEAIQIELTPYGRSLLSLGKLSPKFYSFLDDDVLYDSAAAGFVETNQETSKRILEETPVLKCARDLQSPEGLINNFENSEESTRPHTSLKLNYVTETLGTSDGASELAPTWRATMIQGKISGSVATVLTGSDKCLKQIPQLDCVIEYTMEVRNIDGAPVVSGVQSSPSATVSKVFPDGTYIGLEEEQILCQLLEDNNYLFRDSLEVEVYLYDDTEVENLIPLHFFPKTSNIKDGFLLDEQETSTVTNDDFGEISDKYVEYWINFNTDKMISPKDICDGTSELKSRDVSLSLEVDCPDRESIDFDIYSTNVVAAEDCDD